MTIIAQYRGTDRTVIGLPRYCAGQTTTGRQHMNTPRRITQEIATWTWLPMWARVWPLAVVLWYPNRQYISLRKMKNMIYIDDTKGIAP